MREPCRNRWCKWYSREQATHCDALACRRGALLEDYCIDYPARERAALLYEVAMSSSLSEPRRDYYELQIDSATVDRIRELFKEPSK